MTIFDAIKYPISTPPTEEQLEALPGDLYQKWKEVVGFGFLHVDAGGLYISNFYNNCMTNVSKWRTSEQAILDLNLLRKMIAEYEE
jgi:hypothetical protein